MHASITARVAALILLGGATHGVPARALPVEETPLGALPTRNVRAISYAPQGRHVAKVLSAGKQFRVWLGGQLGPAYPDIAAQGLLFSPDGTRLAYSVVLPRPGGGRVRQAVILDGSSRAFTTASRRARVSSAPTAVTSHGWPGAAAPPPSS